MKLTLSGHRPSCFGGKSGRADDSAHIQNDRPLTQVVRTINLGFLKLKIQKDMPSQPSQRALAQSAGAFERVSARSLSSIPQTETESEIQSVTDQLENSVDPESQMFQSWDEWAEHGEANEPRAEVVQILKCCVRDRRRALSLPGFGLSSLPNTLPPSLEVLILIGNNLQALPAHLPPGLQELDLSGNQLVTLPDNLPPGLQRLDLSANQLTTLPDSLPTRLQILTLNNNQLVTLPNSLPSGLQRLFLCGNQLTELPESLPPGLQYLDLGENHFVTFPENLPQGLLLLGLAHNQISTWPVSLPPRLSVLAVDDNQFSDLPRNLPHSLSDVSVTGNPITSLPEDILSLPNSCCLGITATHLSEAVRNRLSSAMNQPGYNNVQIFFNMGQPNGRVVRSLNEEVGGWVEEAEQASTMDWSAFESEEYAEQFAQFLGRLREPREYLQSSTRANFTQRVFNLLRQIHDDPGLRALCFNLAADAIDTCGDRVALRMLNMESVCLDQKIENALNEGEFDQNPQQLLNHLRAQFRHQTLASAAAEKIKTLNFVDEIEVMLGFIVAFSREFELSTAMNTLLYPNCSNITPEDVVKVRQQLSNRAFTDETKAHYRHFFDRYDSQGNRTANAQLESLETHHKSGSDQQRTDEAFLEFVVNSPVFVKLLKRQLPDEMNLLEQQIEQKVELEKDRLYLQLEQLDAGSANYGEDNKKLKSEYETLHQRITMEKSKDLIQKLARDEGLSLGIDA